MLRLLRTIKLFIAGYSLLCENSKQRHSLLVYPNQQTHINASANVMYASPCCHLMPRQGPPDVSYLIVVEDEIDVSWPLGVVPNKVLVAMWTLLLGVAREHAL